MAVEATGEIRSFDSNSTTFAVQVNGYHSQVTNAGLIYGANGGVLLSGVAAGTASTIVNSGAIVAGVIGVARYASTETVVFNNTGTLSAPTAYGLLLGDSVARDVITNTGRISGTIDFGSGNDSYSGASGHLFGHL